MTLHADRCCLFFPRKLRFASRSQSENREIIVLIILPRKLLRDHDQRWGEATLLLPPNRREMKTRTQAYFSSPLFLIFWNACSSYSVISAIIAADIPGNHVSRGDHGVKNKGGNTGERERRNKAARLCNASLMTVRKFQREWIIHGGKQKGVEVVSDGAMQRRGGLNRNASCTSACVIIFLSLLQQTGWKLG